MHRLQTFVRQLTPAAEHQPQQPLLAPLGVAAAGAGASPAAPEAAQSSEAAEAEESKQQHGEAPGHQQAPYYSSRQQPLNKAQVRELASPHPSLRVGELQLYQIQQVDFYDEPRTYPNVYFQRVVHDEVVLSDIIRSNRMPDVAYSFVRAGPRPDIRIHPKDVKAAIVTCGGLCPGLNDTVQEIFNCLWFSYGVRHIYGIRNGYRGFFDPAYQPWWRLRPEDVIDASDRGGTILGTSRGGFDLEKILAGLVKYGINQLFIIGGDGTHRAAQVISQTAMERNIRCAVACVPKTIDNDIGVIDRSFGFDTSVEVARQAIRGAYVEARSQAPCIGIVKLMGRHAGYISTHATLASRNVDLCLIPEVPFQLDGKHGILPYIRKVLDRQGHAVVVVAEGAGQDLDPSRGKDQQRDASGNIRFFDIGKHLQEQIQAYFANLKDGPRPSIKYIDPSYMIRSCPANAADAVMCLILAHNAVHGAMAGFTGFTSAAVNYRTVLLPVTLVAASSPSTMNPEGRTWQRVVSMTRQHSVLL